MVWGPKGQCLYTYTGQSETLQPAHWILTESAASICLRAPGIWQPCWGLASSVVEVQQGTGPEWEPQTHRGLQAHPP